MKKIHIVIAEDYKLVRQSLEQFFNSDERVKVVACTEDNATLRQLIADHHPEVVLIDVNMGTKPTSEIVKDISKHALSQIVCLSTNPSIMFAKQMLQSGARGYVTKNSSAEELIFSIQEVNIGKKYICQEIKNLLADQLAGEHNDPLDIAFSLSDREMQIVRLIAKGETSKAIAETLGISIKTIEVHRHKILKKLDLKNTTSLVNFFNNTASFLFNPKEMKH